MNKQRCSYIHCGKFAKNKITYENVDKKEDILGRYCNKHYKEVKQFLELGRINAKKKKAEGAMKWHKTYLV